MIAHNPEDNAEINAKNYWYSLPHMVQHKINKIPIPIFWTIWNQIESGEVLFIEQTNSFIILTNTKWRES